MLRELCALGLLAISVAEQVPFESPQNSDRYEFKWPIKDVAIIGAGVSGLLAYRALAEKDHFSKIKIFERDDAPGGNWHYSDETPQSIPIELGDTPEWWKGDFVPHLPEHYPFRKQYRVSSNETSKEELEKARISHRQPKPLWKTLRANTPAPQQQVPGYEWPKGVEWASHHSKVQRYLRSFASWLGINNGDDELDERVSYNTRVELVEKRFDENGKQQGWILTLRKFVRNDEGYEESYWQEYFDAVVVAAGRFNIPHIPPIEGLVDWQKRFPERIIHSRQYRFGGSVEGKNVIVVGASASAAGISQDINSFAKTSYLSIREHSDDPRAPVRRDTHLNALPRNTTIIGEIKKFHPLSDGPDIAEGRIELLNGSIITGIDHLIFGTGFRYSFPFLPQYHNSSVKGNAPVDSEEQPIVTDGSHVRSLYLDTFYIDQPTLAFQGQNVGIQTFVYGKYAGEAIARVWAGQAHLPSKKDQWRHFWRTVEERGGLKKGFQWLNNELNSRYLNLFVAWLNAAAVENGGKLLELPPDVSEEMDLWMKARAAGVSIDPDGRNDFASRSLETDVLDHHQWRKAVLDDW
ncbi:uncharacterized protein I303_108693 [Kwoniella dejecticola CBS 10117]|uniref:FAD/NAD(P)-binding domain-containing protein n=1 Tax=Kwoniella dejecticola CBS 10117 TaxID=1296121 RepID=A0A1A5ZWN8_9TREE|nr:uncharacterized protein I303_06982 [Kwoniella dejecticola CBS 10117]OBR82223.1 hypothetical protein I303_06982 [Kwoniella dejecticola CBS 10117]